MATVTLKGNPLQTIGELPSVGSSAKDFLLTASDLSDNSLNNFSGKRIILNIVPSLDTDVCAASARTFNQRASECENTVVLVVSADLPFAQKRFCEAEGLKNVITLSTFRSTFPEDYGVKITDGPLKGLSSRAIVILDADHKVQYTEQVPEITQEPNYDKALESLKQQVS